MTSDERELAVKLYAGGASAKECAALFGRSANSMWLLMKKSGVVRHTVGRTKNCRADDSFFDVIDSEEKAYWLGFISADGNIKECGVVSLTLAARDSAHVHKFARALRSTYKISSAVYSGFGQTSTSIVSHGLVAGLARLGVHPCKSLTIKPTNVEPELARHYWRGVVDGDGSIHYRANGYYVVNLVGTREMLAGFISAVQSELALSKPSITPNGSICITSYANKKAQLVTDWLYGGASVVLARKAKLAQAAVSAAA